MSQPDFIILFTILFGAFTSISFQRQRYIDKNYWSYLFLFIILYTLIIGLRYGWGNDYMGYKFRMEHPETDVDPFYALTNRVLGALGFNYVMTYMLYAFLMVTSAFKLIRSYPDNKYMLTLFLPAMFFIETSTIRQGFSTSFLFFGISYFYEKKWLKMAIALFLAYSIHTAILVPIAVFTVFYLLSSIYDKPLPIIIVLPLYVVVALSTNAVSSWFVSNFNDSFDWLTHFGRFESYSENSDQWFGEEGIEDKYQQSTSALILSTLFHSAYIYLGYKAICLSGCPKKITYLYNSSIIGLFILRIGMLLEIIHRIGNTLFYFYFIPLGFAISTLKKHWTQLKVKDKALCLSCFIAIVFYLILYFGRFILMSPKYGFVWNQN